jgi:hypothetical protein
MAKLLATRGSQYVMAAIFDLTITDTMVNTAGTEISFKATAGIFDALNLPKDAIVVGGEMVVVTVSNETGTATLKIGDATNDARYVAATNIKAAARTAFTLTGYLGSTGENLRLTFANQNGDATAGRVRITVLYVIKDRTNEVVPA